MADLRKKIDGEDEDDFHNGPAMPAQGSSAGLAQQPYVNRRSGELGRQSADRDRYDSDPHVLGDDFGGLDLRDNEGEWPCRGCTDIEANTRTRAEAPPRPARPLANPDLFKPTPSIPPTGARKVSFQAGPPEDIDALRTASPQPAARQASPGGKTSKWEPLSTVDPTPVQDTDPFSLGDSDDERLQSKGPEVKSEDGQTLKKAAAEAMTDDMGAGQNKVLEAHARSGADGTRDK